MCLFTHKISTKRWLWAHKLQQWTQYSDDFCGFAANKRNYPGVFFAKKKLLSILNCNFPFPVFFPKTMLFLISVLNIITMQWAGHSLWTEQGNNEEIKQQKQPRKILRYKMSYRFKNQGSFGGYHTLCASLVKSLKTWT